MILFNLTFIYVQLCIIQSSLTSLLAPSPKKSCAASTTHWACRILITVDPLSVSLEFFAYVIDLTSVLQGCSIRVNPQVMMNWMQRLDSICLPNKLLKEIFQKLVLDIIFPMYDKFNIIATFLLTISIIVHLFKCISYVRSSIFIKFLNNNLSNLPITIKNSIYNLNKICLVRKPKEKKNIEEK